MSTPMKPASQVRAVKFALALVGAVFLLMMVVGLAMRAAQVGVIELDPAFFYQFMTVHGAGMVGTAGLSGACIMWFFLGRHVVLNGAVFWIFLSLFLTGVALILVSVFVGQFGAGWTFLYPLPSMSGGAWEPWAAACFVVGYVVIGVGFLLLYLEVGRALIKSYGSLTRALGWHVAFGGASPDDAPAPTVIAAASVTIFNTLGIVVGAVVLIATLINLLVPGFEVDALLAKNMTYFFGHVFINASIYMAVIAVYEIIPEYTGQAWKSSRIFALSWASILLFVMAVYPHHLLQDMVMPAWTLIVGQVVSYLSGIPLLAVTSFSLLAYLRRSHVQWDLASALLVLGVAGWSIGSVPAIMDGMIVVNKVMHNTQWVPGHFHMYLILGEVAMLFGFMAWLTKRDSTQASFPALDRTAFFLYVVGGSGFVLMFLISGAMSVPRRWAVHVEDWIIQGQIATGFGVLVIVGAVLFVARYLGGLSRAN